MENNLGNKETMAKNLRKYMEKNNVTRNKLCDDLGFKYTTVRDWLKGITYPRIDKIEMMARYFGITKADLVEDFDTIDVDQVAKSAERQKKIDRLPDELLEELDKYIDYLLTKL